MWLQRLEYLAIGSLICLSQIFTHTGEVLWGSITLIIVFALVKDLRDREITEMLIEMHRRVLTTPESLQKIDKEA